MAKLMSGEIRSLPHLSASFAGLRKLELGRNQISSRYRKPPLATRKERTPAKRKKVSNRRYTSDDDYDESDASEAPNPSARVKPIQATLQTQRMLEESGSDRYWGAVYSLTGERIGTSHVGSNLQNVTVQTIGSSSASFTDRSPPRQWKNRMYVGRWQDTWGFRPEISDDPNLEGGTCVNKRSRNNKGPGHIRFYYLGNQNVIRVWRNSQSKVIQRPPALPPSDDTEIHTSPSDPPPFNKTCNRYEVTHLPQNDDTSADEEGEGEDDGRNFWAVQDRSSPPTDLPFLPANDISRAGLGNANNIPDACLVSTLGSCGQPVTQDGLVKAITSGLQAVGTTVLLP